MLGGGHGWSQAEEEDRREMIGTRPRTVGASSHFAFWTTAMSSFRESSIVILDTSRTLVRAGLGLHELLKTPTVVCSSASSGR